MTIEQIAAFAIMGGMVVLFVWDRWRYDLVALGGLLAAIAAGIVKPEQAFAGFSDQIVIIVGAALVLSQAINRSGVVTYWMRPLAPLMGSTTAQVGILGTIVAVLSAFVKNIGALATFLPIALQAARRSGHSPSRLLMPLAFASLLGGLMTLIGTSPNIIVAGLRAELVGAPFAMFDFLPVGAGIAALGLVFLALGWRLLPENQGGRSDKPFEIAEYTTEALLAAGSPLDGKTVADLETLGEGDVVVAGIIREGGRRYRPSGRWTLHAGDELVLEGETDALKRLTDAAKLELVASRELPEAAEGAKPVEHGIVEAVVVPDSKLVNATLAGLRLRDRYAINVLAISRNGKRVTQRLRHLRFRSGDVVVIEGREDELPEVMTQLGVLPLAARNVELGRGRPRYHAVIILAVAMLLIAFKVVPATVGFFGAAVAVFLSGALSIRNAYEAMDWPILVLIAALIPVSDALRSTGGTELIAGWLSGIATVLPPFGTVTLMMVTAMLVTPFLNNAATVLIMAPVAVGFARELGLNADPFLMAVAVGAGCDFLTPIGHQCNTLVMGPGCYRFSDYWRLGLPLSILVAVAGTALIVLVWPLG